MRYKNRATEEAIAATAPVWVLLLCVLALSYCAPARAGELIYMPTVVHLGGAYDVSVIGEGEDGDRQVNHYVLNDEPHFLAARSETGWLAGAFRNSYGQGSLVVGHYAHVTRGRWTAGLNLVGVYGYSRCHPGSQRLICNAGPDKRFARWLWKPSDPAQPGLLLTGVPEVGYQLNERLSVGVLVPGNAIGFPVRYHW